MKNKIILGFMIACTVFLGACAVNTTASAFGGNKMWYDTDYFDTAIINLHDKVITVKIKSWTDFEDGEQLQIKAVDGTVYLTNSFNCTLIQSAR